MKLRILLGIALLVIAVMVISCGRTYFRYVSSTEIPRMVYVGDESILNMETVAGRLYAKDVFVEVTTLDGKTSTGKLLRIDEGELMMSPSYYYDTEGESMSKIDVERVIPKDQILVLKIY